MVQCIHWFRQDLRLADNPALRAACAYGAVLPLYILDDKNAGAHKMGEASRWWLHHALLSLNQSLHGRLAVGAGDPMPILLALIARHSIRAVFWNRCYEPWRSERDKKIEARLKKQGIQIETHNASLLWDPWQVAKKDGTPYKVFTPFYRAACATAEPPRPPLRKPCNPKWIKSETGGVEALRLLDKTAWHKSLARHWQVGEAQAQTRLKAFVKAGLPHYQGGRDLPAKPYVSRLSPHLHFGEISPNQAWHKAQSATAPKKHRDSFCRQLGWREFSYSQLYYNPRLPRENLQKKFDKFPWQNNPQALRAWQRGQTGIPLIDAGMRELWQTGYMHNRVRMLVGSFLVKNLLLHWHHGERWFWNTLVDADLANNSASWQWVAGCGADAAPYFRIFNPVTQGKKFDADGDYVRRFVPELAGLPTKNLFAPWQAPATTLMQAKVVLGKTYPHPITTPHTSRQTALKAFKSISKPSD